MWEFFKRVFGGPAPSSADQLSSHEERFRLLVEGVKEYAIFMLDPQGRIVTWNAGAERLKGYTAEEIIRQPFSRFYPPEDVESGKPDRELEIAKATGKYEEEGWRVRKDASRFWASVVITALRDPAGRLRGFAKVTRDMTERKEAEESARRLLQEEAARQAAEASAQEARRAQQEERRHRQQLHVTLSSIGDAVIVTDDRGAVTFLNPVAQKLTGWQQSDAAGQPLEQVFRIINEETRQPVENPVSKVLREGVVIGLANHTILVARDGREAPIDDSGAPIRTDDGPLAGVVLVFRDVTEARRAVQALKESERQLRETDQRKNEFLAMLAHELRNPLAPIRNAVQVIKMPGATPEIADQARQMIERQVQHMVRLVDDLLDVSRIMRGKIDLRREPVELAAVSAQAVETTQPIIDAQGQQLIVSIPSEPVWLEADPARLAQVIGNLLHNAAKFSQRAGRIWLTAERQGSEAVIRVRDQGAGIRPDLLPHIFDLFVQGDRSLERTSGGLGIGLTVVRKLLELHGGSIRAHSPGLGQGSEFLVRLPALPEPPQKEPGGAGRRPLPAAVPRRVLVVDDNVDAAESAALLLRLWGHDVRLTHTGPDALQAAQDFRPGIILLDIGLPGINGHEVARRLREQPQFQRTVLVAVTGYGQWDDRRRSQEAGFDHHLTKPVDPDALMQLLAQAETQP